MNLSTIEPSETFFNIVFSVILLLTGIGMAISVGFITTIRTNQSLQSIANLHACSSCIFGLFYFVFHILYVILAFHPLPTYRQDSLLCRITGYMYAVTCSGVCWSHAVLAFNRLCFLIFPTRKELLTYTFARYLIGLHWLLVFVLPSPFLFFDAYRYESESRLCILTTKNTSTALFAMILFYSIPTLMMIMVYIVIWLHVRRTRMAKVSRSARNLDIMRHILTLVIIDVICGHPYITLIVLDYLGRASKEWYLIVIAFVTLSVTANMGAIVLFNRELRQHVFSKWLGQGARQSTGSAPGSPMVPMHPSKDIGGIDSVRLVLRRTEL